MLSRAQAFVSRLWTAAPIATIILSLALAGTFFFGVRTVLFWQDRAIKVQQEQDLADWMTPRYVARSWRVPPAVILDALDAPVPPPDGPMTLAELAEFRGVPVEQVIAEAESAIAAFREGTPRDTPSGIGRTRRND